jgi:tetratricopeptide (TPR) repeat protein
MELTLSQAIKKGIEAQRAGKVQEADRYYTAILKVQPKHPEANHNLGVLALEIGKTTDSLSFFQTAVEVNPKKVQFWLSYINALMKLDRLADAKVVLANAKNKGVKGKNFEELEAKIAEPNEITASNHNPKKFQSKILDTLKLDQALKLAKNKAKDGSKKEAEYIYGEILAKFPKNKKAISGIRSLSGKFAQKNPPAKRRSQVQKTKNPHKIQMQGLLNLHYQGKFHKALSKASQLLFEFPDSLDLYNFIGITNRRLGKLNESINAYKKAISLKSSYFQAYNNMGTALVDQGKLEKAKTAYKKAIEYKPDYAEAMWNLSGTVKDISEAKGWLEKCLSFDPNYEEAKLTLCALEYYQGNKTSFDFMAQSALSKHPYMRSFLWAFGLPMLPELFFNRWALFDRIIELSEKDRPFYEFGVWRGEAFRYFIETFKKGFGFDTFEGLPEEWDDFKAGSYTSDGNIPKIRGGEFIVGKFEDTLPRFFSQARPTASIINFDADLYSSTICALNFAAPVIDQHTILIFDEFLINPNWEQDEYKALEEFCNQNNYKYEVLAISFFTKQVAVRLVCI